MPQYTYKQLEQLWVQAGGSPVLAPLMAAIAEAESGGNSDALNLTDNNGTQTSVGLWQVSTGTHDYPPDWATPLGNAREAVNKLQTQGITAWGTYTSGAYKQFYQAGPPPPGSLTVGGVNPHPGGGGLLSSLVGDIWGLLGMPLGLLKGVSDVPAAILTLAGPFVKLAQVLDWFLHPSNWIRLFAGLAGGILVLGGVWQMSHAGGG